MLRTENNNLEILAILNGKLQRDYDKLYKKLPKKELSENQQKVLDSMTLGNPKNDKVIGVSLAVASVPSVIGLGEALVGMVSLLPSTEQAPTPESVSFFEAAKTFGENAVSGGIDKIISSVPLFILPASVAAISLSTRIYRQLVTKRVNKMNYTGATVQLIDDLIDRKEDDPTLEFASTFMKRVDLTENDPKINLEILKYMTYYRYMLQQQELGKATEEEVEEAYKTLIICLNHVKSLDGTSQHYKNNRFLNLLINNYEEMEMGKEEQEISEGFHK